MIGSNYFDYAAATPIDPAVLKAMTPYLKEFFYNPSAEYLAAKQIASDIKQSRADIAKYLGVRPSEIIFTAGGTEANNLAIRGIMSQHPDSNLVISNIEHKSVIEPAKLFQCRMVGVNNHGVVDVLELEQCINDDTVLVSVMYANNELGTIQPLKEISQLISRVKSARKSRGIKLPLLFHTDASQAGNYLNLKVNSLGVDMMTVNGGKIYGPKQTGILYVRKGTQLIAQINGGGQENNYRSGTENVAGIVGFATALANAQTIKDVRRKEMEDLKTYFIKQLTEKVPQATINNGEKSLPNFVHISLPNSDNEIVMMQLDEAGYQVAVGSACAASSEEPSHVLKAIGMSDKEARSSLRFSMGRYTTKEAIEAVVTQLATICG